MSDVTLIIIIAILDLQLKAVAVGGMFYIVYKFYILFRTFLFEISKDIKQLTD